jgi:lambda repressor-like predicted transcriptional regulator
MRLDELEGGKAVLGRMLQAYGFSMQKELGDRFGLSSGTISTWVRRNYFPGDVVVVCALDTGVSLRWLATGQGAMHDNQLA